VLEGDQHVVAAGVGGGEERVGLLALEAAGQRGVVGDDVADALDLEVREQRRGEHRGLLVAHPDRRCRRRGGRGRQQGGGDE
jgi:hypothetical protein